MGAARAPACKGGSLRREGAPMEPCVRRLGADYPWSLSDGTPRFIGVALCREESEQRILEGV